MQYGYSTEYYQVMMAVGAAIALASIVVTIMWLNIDRKMREIKNDPKRSTRMDCRW